MAFGADELRFLLEGLGSVLQFDCMFPLCLSRPSAPLLGSLSMTFLQREDLPSTLRQKTEPFVAFDQRTEFESS